MARVNMRETRGKQPLRNLLAANDLIRDYVKDKYPIQYACVLLEILTLGEGKQLRDLEQRTGMTASSVQRAVSTLSDIDWRGGEGAGLVELKVDPADARYKNIYLTGKGKRLRDKLIGATDGSA
ncbi:MAG: hypothetical protein GEU78_10400 [Actinobacteria bacterium]|nr:hypothetical protein [Actinomycetota bacterium]